MRADQTEAFRGAKQDPTTEVGSPCSRLIDEIVGQGLGRDVATRGAALISQPVPTRAPPPCAGCHGGLGSTRSGV